MTDKTMDELLQTEVPSMKLVANYVKQYAKDHKWNRVEATQRTIQQCYGHITDLAKKEANGHGSVAIEDSTVYRWAIEFYNSDKIETVKTIAEPVQKATKPVAKPKKVEVEKVLEDEQLSLFD